jgi:hypothetical protein
MAHLDPTNPIESDSELTVKKLKEAFSFIKESTMSSPNGLHHGVCKTLIKDEHTFEPYSLMIMFAFKFGEPPDAWTNATQVKLGKDDPCRTHQDQLHLMDAAHPCGNEHGFLHHMGPRDGLLSPYQFGGVSSHISISCILLKQTSYDII